MNQETLQKAKELDKQIFEFSEALNCFQWEDTGHSRNPRLIIEFDDNDDGRERLNLPMNLSDALIEFLKNEIIKGRVASELEFLKL